MPIVREILTKFSFKADDDKLDKINHSLEAVKEKLSLIAGIEVAKGLFELAERFSAVGTELRTAAMSAGLTVENFQELALSAKLAAVDQGQMETALFRVARRLHEAREGSQEAMMAFSKAGFSYDQIKGFRNSEEVLLALSDRFRQIKDPIERSAMAAELMGRGSMHMVAWLSQGSKAIREEMSEARKFGLELSTNEVGALVKMEHALTKVNALFHALAGRLAAEVAPIITYMADKFLALFEANHKLVQVNIEGWLTRFAYSAGFVFGIVEGLVEKAKEFVQFFHLEGKIGELAANLSMVAGIVTALTIAWTLWNAQLALTAAAITGLIVLVHDMWAIFKNQPTWIESIEGTLRNADWGKLRDVFQKVTGAPAAAINSMGGNTMVGPTSQMNNFGNNQYTAHFSGGSVGEQTQAFDEMLNRHSERQRSEAFRSIPQIPLR